MFKDLLTCKSFIYIHSSLQLYPPDADERQTCTTDPLWNFKAILEHFPKNCVDIAVPKGLMTLDENKVRTKAWTAARLYISLKPVYFGIRFYMLAGCSNAYVHSIISGKIILEIEPIFPLSIHFYGPIGVCLVSSCVSAISISFQNYPPTRLGQHGSLSPCS